MALAVAEQIALEGQDLPRMYLAHDELESFTITVIITILWLQVAAYEQAKQLVWQRKAAIEQLATELTSDPLETVQGKRIVEVIETTAVADPELLPSNGVWSDAQVLVQEPDVSMHGCNQVA